MPEYLPAGQILHDAEFVLKYSPARHWIHSEAPSSLEKDPAGQVRQDDAPIFEYSPAAHFEQEATPPGEY